jgi:hypothetical protein
MKRKCKCGGNLFVLTVTTGLGGIFVVRKRCSVCKFNYDFMFQDEDVILCADRNQPIPIYSRKSIRKIYYYIKQIKKEK